MDQAITDLERIVTVVQKRIDGLSWKIKQCERVLFSENKIFHSSKVISMITNLAEMCRKYDEIISLVNKSRNEQKVFTETLQLQVNIVKSKVETLTALITKGKTTSI